MDDWEKDLQWAKDHCGQAEDAEALSYEAFFHSIYELVDTWTETAFEDEYIDMVRRLVDGVTEEDPATGKRR